MTLRVRRLRALARGRRGGNMIEAALITPLLLLLTFAIVDFAGLFYAWLALESGVSQATRYGITGNVMEDPDNPGESLSREDSIKAAMRDATPTLTIDDDAFTFTHRPEGGASWIAGAGGPGDIVRVSVDYDWELWTPLIRPFFADGQITLTTESAMKNETRFN